MKKYVLFCLCLLPFFALQAQFHYTLTSFPDSAEVIVNGENRCHTPCNISYFWKDNRDDKMIFAVKAPGYEMWTDTLYKKPYELTRRKSVKLERYLPDMLLDSSNIIVGFDKLLAEFKDGRPIGQIKNEKGKIEIIKWEGNTKIGERSFERSFYEIMEELGFKTPLTKKTSLFAENENRVQLPRYMVGIALKDLNINLENDKKEDYGAGKIKGSAEMQFEWQVLDKRSGKVVLVYENKGRTNFRSRWKTNNQETLVAFEQALMDFLINSGFAELVRNTESIYDAARLGSMDTTKVRVAIQSPVVPKFASLSEMIRYADRACVTVVTDAGHGSGVIVDQEGYVLSAYHVVEGVNKIQVKFSDGLKLDARIVNYDVLHDIVLLDIAGSGFQSLRMDVSTDVGLGEDVVTIGTPADLDLGQSISRGILSGKRLVDERIYFQMDMAVSPGNSGGPVLNSAGEVMAIIQRKLIGKGIEGISFALPVATAVEVLGMDVK